jgi:hypothetical protein
MGRGFAVEGGKVKGKSATLARRTPLETLPRAQFSAFMLNAPYRLSNPKLERARVKWKPVNPPGAL